VKFRKETAGVSTRQIAYRWARAFSWLLLLLLAGCGRGCTSRKPPIHVVPNMDWQPKAKAQSESGFFHDGVSMRRPIVGTVARGDAWDATPRMSGRNADGSYAVEIPIQLSEAQLERGAVRYGIYCAVCHTERGDGKGVLFERGKVPTPSFHEDRLKTMPAGQIFETITHGYGLMPQYGYPIPVDDRWAIIAHVRRLQQEQSQGAGQ
jgi:mono/diheme cytochrome c family protein